MKLYNRIKAWFRYGKITHCKRRVKYVGVVSNLTDEKDYYQYVCRECGRVLNFPVKWSR